MATRKQQIYILLNARSPKSLVPQNILPKYENMVNFHFTETQRYFYLDCNFSTHTKLLMTTESLWIRQYLNINHFCRASMSPVTEIRLFKRVSLGCYEIWAVTGHCCPATVSLSAVCDFCASGRTEAESKLCSLDWQAAVKTFKQWHRGLTHHITCYPNPSLSNYRTMQCLKINQTVTKIYI